MEEEEDYNIGSIWEILREHIKVLKMKRVCSILLKNNGYLQESILKVLESKTSDFSFSVPLESQEELHKPIVARAKSTKNQKRRRDTDSTDAAEIKRKKLFHMQQLNCHG